MAAAPATMPSAQRTYPLPGGSTRAAAQHAARRRLRGAARAPLGGHHDGRHRARRRRQPADALQGVRLARGVRAGARHAREPTLPGRGRACRHRPSRRPGRALWRPPSTCSSPPLPRTRSCARSSAATAPRSCWRCSRPRARPLVESAAERLTEVMLASWPLVRRRDAELLERVPGAPRDQLRRAAERARQHDGDVDRDPARALHRAARRAGHGLTGHASRLERLLDDGRTALHHRRGARSELVGQYVGDPHEARAVTDEPTLPHQRGGRAGASGGRG